MNKKAFLVKNVFIDYDNCCYESDIPDLHEDYKLFKSRADAEKFIASLPKRYVKDWEILELPVL